MEVCIFMEADLPQLLCTCTSESSHSFPLRPDHQSCDTAGAFASVPCLFFGAEVKAQWESVLELFRVEHLGALGPHTERVVHVHGGVGLVFITGAILFLE